MAIRIRRKNFSWFNFGNNKNSVPKEIVDDEITFAEGYNSDYWPAVVIVGIKDDPSKPHNGWVETVELLRKKGLFTKGGTLEAIHHLSYKDNVNGKGGSNVVVLVFSKDTDISSYVRLSLGDHMKWPEDFFCSYNNYYTWYKSGKQLFKSKNFSKVTKAAEEFAKSNPNAVKTLKNPLFYTGVAGLGVSSANYVQNKKRREESLNYQEKQLDAMNNLTQQLGKTTQSMNKFSNKLDSQENSSKKDSGFVARIKRKLV